LPATYVYGQRAIHGTWAATGLACGDLAALGTFLGAGGLIKLPK
jgi:hypothetical protein